MVMQGPGEDRRKDGRCFFREASVGVLPFRAAVRYSGTEHAVCTIMVLCITHLTGTSVLICVHVYIYICATQHRHTIIRTQPRIRLLICRWPLLAPTNKQTRVSPILEGKKRTPTLRRGRGREKGKESCSSPLQPRGSALWMAPIAGRSWVQLAVYVMYICICIWSKPLHCVKVCVAFAGRVPFFHFLSASHGPSRLPGFCFCFAFFLFLWFVAVVCLRSAFFFLFTGGSIWAFASIVDVASCIR